MRPPPTKVLCLSLLVLALCWFGINQLSKRQESPAPAVTSAVAPSPSRPVVAPSQSVVTKTEPAPPIAPVPPKPVVSATVPLAVATLYPQMSMEEVLKPGNLFQDDVFGVSVNYPEGWVVADARRWGENNRENTVFMKPPEPLLAAPSMYYQKYRETPPGTDQAEAYLRQVAQGKEDSRSNNGANDYKNVPGSFDYREINGRPALSYSAVYSQGDKVMTEYFVRILGKDGYVMFFMRGNPEDVQALAPVVNQMAATVKVP